MAADLEIGAPNALAKLAAVRRAIVAASTARITSVGSSASHAALAPDLAALVGTLDPAPRARQTYSARPAISERLKDHDRTPGAPAYVGLFSPATSSGVFINNAPSTGLTDEAEPALLDYLASNTFTGHGAHSLFMKTWAAGLAYSNGVHPFVRQAELEYYAERCPLLPQTMRFVVAQLQQGEARSEHRALRDRDRVRLADRRGLRGARDGDGRRPRGRGDARAGARRSARKLLGLAGQPDLAQRLFARLPAVYGKVLPGYGTPAASGAINFVIGPAKQLDAYQAYLRAVVDNKLVLHRLYPRDFWVPAKL